MENLRTADVRAEIRIEHVSNTIVLECYIYINFLGESTDLRACKYIFN
jgi:hypothetical protein